MGFMNGMFPYGHFELFAFIWAVLFVGAMLKSNQLKTLTEGWVFAWVVTALGMMSFLLYHLYGWMILAVE